MLRVTTLYASSAKESARYYTRYLARDGPESDGHWLGRQADALGLSGAVSTDDLEALLDGRDPATGTRLGRPLVDRVDAKGRLIRAVAGFDATFSAPKSLSVWWALTGDPGLVEAHDLGVRTVLEHLERYGATTRVRVNGHRQHPDANGLTMAVFQQGTSREDDPQLHSHVVVSAKVTAPDGRWMALDGRYLKRHQRALGGLYQSVLRAELTNRYGVAWELIVNGQAEIAGMPRELLDAFSKRTAQVEELLARKVDAFRDREGRDPTRWERAAIAREAAEDSRAAKSGAAVDQLADGWQGEARALGWTGDRLGERLRDVGHDAPAQEQPTVTGVVDELSAAGSTWTRADVLKVICDLTPAPSDVPGQQWSAALERATDTVTGVCTTLDPDHRHGSTRASDGRSLWIAPTEPHLTSDGILAQEERILAFAADAHAQPPALSPTIRREGLDVLQAAAAAAVAGDDPLVLVVGPAGTGKTTALRRAADDLGRQRRPVFGVAPTAKAAKVLHDEPWIPADTVAKLLYEWRDGRPRAQYALAPGTTVVVDEAGMLGTGSLDRLIALAATQRWRLVLVGDPRQLQAVGRGGMFDELCRSSRVHELATIHRFRHRWEQIATLRLRHGRADALDAYFDHDRVESGNLPALLDDVARRWADHASSGRSVAVTAETNEHVAALNAAIQHERVARGHLGPVGARIADGATASTGDIVVTRRNDRTLITGNGQPVRNRERWCVTAVHGDGQLTVSHMGGHGTVTLPADYVRTKVELGYAATAHGQQGDTVDVSLALITAATSHRSLYVGATRGRDENRLLVVTSDEEDARDALDHVLTNDRADIPAVAQRRLLAEQHRHGSPGPTADEQLAIARRRLGAAQRDAQPVLDAVRNAEAAVATASAQRTAVQRELQRVTPWRRGPLRRQLQGGDDALRTARGEHEKAVEASAPARARIAELEAAVRDAERLVSSQRLSERLRRLELRPSPTRAQGRTPPGR